MITLVLAAVVSYAGFGSSGYPMVKSSGVVDTAYVRDFSRFPVVSVDINAAMQRPDALLLLRQVNPDVRVLGYQLITHWWLGPTFTPRAGDVTFYADWHRAIQATGGFRPNAPSGYEVDWSNDATADTLGRLLHRAMASGLFDGLFADYCAPIKMDGSPDSAAASNMKRAINRALTARCGLSLVANGWGAERVSPVTMREGFPDRLTSFQQALNMGPGDWLKAELWVPFDSPDGQRQARFVTGTAALTGAHACIGTDRVPSQEGRWWLREWGVDVGDAAGVAWRDQGVWQREYARGVWFVNESDRPATVDIRWRRLRRMLDPTIINAVTVPARDAVLLLRAQKPKITP